MNSIIWITLTITILILHVSVLSLSSLQTPEVYTYSNYWQLRPVRRLCEQGVQLSITNVCEYYPLQVVNNKKKKVH